MRDDMSSCLAGCHCWPAKQLLADDMSHQDDENYEENVNSGEILR
jgi:hypothetical protein